ncbi:hypothetical protein [Stenomitos frigidus]|uniref:hypothetical protein n=1 Tax=Stenomitos frigidus TaxID=1886765 RepID=UPI001C628ABD|nr:hypothetical protein [Stenomitos frigidus]
MTKALSWQLQMVGCFASSPCDQKFWRMTHEWSAIAVYWKEQSFVLRSVGN